MSTTIFPSQNTWITARTEENRITTNNCVIILNQTIDKIDKMIINVPDAKINTPINMEQTRTQYAFLSELYTDDTYSTSLVTLDITKYVVERAKYNTLSRYGATDPIPWGKITLNNAWYYEHNAKNIILINSKPDIFSGVVSQNLILFTLYDFALKNNGIYFKRGNQTDIISANSLKNVTASAIENVGLLTMQFRIYYTPLGESINLETPKTNPQPTQFAIPYSQQQPIVDNVTHGREMQSIANRTGCEKREVVRTFHDIKDYRDPHDHWYYKEKDANGNYTGNVWVLTGARLEIYCETMFRVIETWSKNWSYRSENVPINREFRSWNIPADIVQRNLHWNDYCLITRKDVDLTDAKPVLLSDIAKTEFMRGFDGSKSNYATECNNMWFYQKDDSGNVKGAVMSCSTFGFANALVFSGKTKDNLSAGMQRVKSDDGDSNYQFCKDVYYCNEDGKIDEMYVQFGAGISDNDPYLYPECYLNDDGQKNLYAANDVVYLFDEHKFKVLKDPCEQLNFTYQLHLLTDDGFLVIGSTLASNNPLVKERDKPQTIKVWKLTQYIPQGAQVMTPIYGTKQDSSLFSVVVDSANPSITFNPAGTTNNGVGVCVTDENDAVLIAFNDNSPATFKIKFTHEYKAIAKAIKK